MTLWLPTTYTVYTADEMAIPSAPGVWTEQPHLICDDLVRGTAPTISSAMLRWEFGTESRQTDAGPEAPMAYVNRLSLHGKYVRIKFTSHDLEWYGYVTANGLDLWAQEDDGGGEQRLSGGTDVFTAYGFEWFLGGETIHKSKLVGGAIIDRAIGFNTGFGEGRGVAYESRGNMDQIGGVFAASPDLAEEWNGKEIVEYLLDVHHPRDSAGNKSPIDFVLIDSAEPFLDWFKPTVETAGRSVLEILNEIISVNRCLAWWLDVIVDPDNPLALVAAIKVTSGVTAPVALPDGDTLPAALSIGPFFPDDHFQQPQVTRDLARQYDVVIVRGAPRRAVCTLSQTSGNLEINWDAALETEYKAAVGLDEKENDRFRQADRFESVYQRFRTPQGWNGTSNDGGSVPTSDSWACPQQPQGGTSLIGASPLGMQGLRLLRTLPMKQGVNYSDATAPVGSPPADTADEWQRPFAVIDVGGGKWRFLHEINTNEEDDGEERLTSYGLRVLASTPGIQLSPSGGMPHCLAKNHFDPDVDGPSAHTPELDHELMRVTVAAEWDAWCEGRWPATDPVITDRPLRRLYIDIGDRARHDWLAEGTIFDIENGALQTVATGGALRDDRNLCVKVAQLAYQYYGVTRAEFTVSDSLRVINPVIADVGDLITNVGIGAAAETVNALVSQIRYRPEESTTTLSAGFAELDFRSLI